MTDKKYTNPLTWESDTAITPTRLNQNVGEDSGGIGGNLEWLKSIQMAESGGELTIAAGVVAIDGDYGFYTIDTQADAAADDLDTINPNIIDGGLASLAAYAGFIVVLRVENAARVVTIKSGTGNIDLPGEDDIDLDDINKLVALRYDGTNWQLIGGAGGGASVYVLEDAGLFYPAGGLMSSADRALLTWDADPTTNLDKLYDGNDGGTFWASTAQLQDSPFITIDFLQGVVFDSLRIAQTEGNNYASQVTLYGSNTGDFTGEEVLVATLTGMTNGIMTPSIPNPASYRYWKFVFYRSSSDTYAPYDFNFNRNATMLIQGLPFGCEVKLFDGVSLEETRRYNNQIHDGFLEFDTDMTGLTDPNITITRPDGSTAWLAFDSTVISNSDNGVTYSLFVEGE